MFFYILLLFAITVVSYNIYSKRREARELREFEEAQRVALVATTARHRAKFDNCYRIALTQAELDAMVQPKTPGFDPNTCELGTWFIYPPDEFVPDVLVVAHIVDTMNAFSHQVGARTSLPPRFANAFRVKVIDTDSLENRMRDTDFVVMERMAYLALEEGENDGESSLTKPTRFVRGKYSHPHIKLGEDLSKPVYFRDTGF